jgi:flotillin
MISTWIVAAGIVVATLMLLGFVAQMYRKVGPNEAFIVYGAGGTRVIKGGGTLIFPMIHSWKTLSLELMSFDVAPTQDLYTRQGVAVTVEAVAQIKVKSDRESILTGAEQFLSKTPQQREGLIRLVMEGHLRGIIGQLAVEEIVKEPEMVADRMRATCADDMDKMGLEVVSFTIKEVRDGNEYITNMGRPDVARIRMLADIAAAEAERDTAIKRAEALREAAVKRAEADQQRVLAETVSLAAQAAAQNDLEVKRAQLTATTKREQAQADKAYEIQTKVMEQQVVAESVRVQQVEKEGQIKVQEAEILRHEKELIATVLKAAEVERMRIETLAAAERQRLIAEAEGRASSVRTEGEAEAEIIFRKGEAEARAMNVKAEAYQEWNQAAVVDKLMTQMPEVVRALAAPLANVDRITIVSTGEGETAGAHRITGDLAAIAAQVPALFESRSGMQWPARRGTVMAIGLKMGRGGTGRGARVQAPLAPYPSPLTPESPSVTKRSPPCTRRVLSHGHRQKEGSPRDPHLRAHDPDRELASFGAGRLERRTDRIDEADDPGRGPRRGEQARLRPEDPLHHDRHREVGQPGPRRHRGALLPGRRHAPREARGGGPGRQRGDARQPALRQRTAGQAVAHRHRQLRGLRLGLRHGRGPLRPQP